MMALTDFLRRAVDADLMARELNLLLSLAPSGAGGSLVSTSTAADTLGVSLRQARRDLSRMEAAGLLVSDRMPLERGGFTRGWKAAPAVFDAPVEVKADVPQSVDERMVADTIEAFEDRGPAIFADIEGSSLEAAQTVWRMTREAIPPASGPAGRPLRETFLRLFLEEMIPGQSSEGFVRETGRSEASLADGLAVIASMATSTPKGSTSWDRWLLGGLRRHRTDKKAGVSS